MAAEGRKVYGNLNNLDTLKVLVCLFEHDLDFEFVPVNVEANQHRQKQFLSISPFGKLPALEDPDVTLFEATTIVRYMGHMYANKKKVGEELIFWESWKQAVVANWIDVEDHYFEPASLKLIALLSGKAEIDSECDGVDREIAGLSEVLDVYEAQLGKFKYVAADKFTVTDILHLPNLHSLMGIAATKKLIESRPRFSAWCSEILARPSWTKVLRMKQQQKTVTQA